MKKKKMMDQSGPAEPYEVNGRVFWGKEWLGIQEQKKKERRVHKYWIQSIQVIKVIRQNYYKL